METPFPATTDNQQCKYRPPARKTEPPISRLTDDLLSYIIYACSADDGTSNFRSGKILVETARFTAQVNRRWRRLALSYKLIWLGPALNWFSPHQWVDEVLRRSHPLPLDAAIPFDAAKRNPLIVFNALKHVPRIRSLELELLIHWWLVIVESKELQKAAPFLEQFSLIINTGFDKREHYTPEPQMMFGGYAPRLQHFEIQNCSIDLTRRIFHSLRVLVIDNVQHISVAELMVNLSHMKLLERIHITRTTDDNAFPDTNSQSPSIPEVHLLNLSELMVSAPLSACACILQFMYLPSSCSIEVDAHNAHHEGQDLTTVCSRIASMLSNWTCEPLSGRQSIHFGMAEIGYSVEAPRTGGMLHREQPFIGLTFSWYGRITQVDMLFAIFPLLTATFNHCRKPPDTLSILASREIPHLLIPNMRNLLAPWLQSMDYIQALEFQGHRTFTLMEKLFQGPEVIMPYMGDIIFHKVDFYSEKRHAWRRLLKILKFREHEDAPILMVDFVNCVGEFRGENLPGRFGTIVKINGRDCSDDDNDREEDDGEDSDYTVRGFSD